MSFAGPEAAGPLAENGHCSPASQVAAKAAKKRITGARAFKDALAKLPRRGAAASVSFQIPLAEIATLLGLSFQQAVDVFSNGRAYSQIGEEQAAMLLGFCLHAHKDVAGTDGFRKQPQADGTELALLVSVKSAARGNIKFQMSVFTGAGRPCTPQNLRSSIEKAHTIASRSINQLCSDHKLIVWKPRADESSKEGLGPSLLQVLSRCQAK